MFGEKNKCILQFGKGFIARDILLFRKGPIFRDRDGMYQLS